MKTLLGTSLRVVVLEASVTQPLADYYIPNEEFEEMRNNMQRHILWMEISMSVLLPMGIKNELGIKSIHSAIGNGSRETSIRL